MEIFFDKQLAIYFFLSGLSFTSIHDSQGSKGRGRVSIQLLSTTSTRFAGTQTLAGRLLHGAHLWTQLAAELELETFGFRAQVAHHWATRPSFPMVFTHVALVFPRLPRVFLLFPLSVSPVSYFRFCGYLRLFSCY